jgi:hypothetical protein
MRNFQCQHCGNLVFFENVLCLKCDSALGFVPDLNELRTLEDKGGGVWEVAGLNGNGGQFRKCANATEFQICNWMVACGDANPLCASCRMNDVVPNLAVTGNRERWHKLELAKRRLLYALRRLNLPVDPAGAAPGLRFSFIADASGGRASTGHCKGLITIDINEADEDKREQQRIRLREPYRTLLGHFRHESGHYYWDRLINNTPRLPAFRERFGDETPDYAAAMERYYQHGPPPDWQERCVSTYASSHPWEDWAETWAHYLHMVDTLEIAGDCGIRLEPAHNVGQASPPTPDGLLQNGFERLSRDWFALSNVLNSLNRGMGLSDLYPFVVSDTALAKLRFVHEVVESAATEPAGAVSNSREPSGN